MHFIKYLVCFASGMAILPLFIAIGEKLNIIGFKGVPVVAIFIILIVFLAGGLIIGLIMPRQQITLTSILFGIAPFVWSIVFLFIWGWIRESSSGAVIIPLSLIPAALSYFGARASAHYKS